ncbi:unnamed protein product [Adineta steineri]|uniref:Nuclear receptor domain-containing protein n=3 Tax=Adineta steineri TaxID=433720 RepID=A0A815M1M1_9BILA|nr:unnamed protein product [Adineta steineri]
MSGQTKMIFITSDEDLVHKISATKSTNTRIIDLDDHEQMSLTINDKNIINLALAELSELNSTDHNQSKENKISKKSIDSVCKICGDRAIGFNYDVLSCASCKAFFRRNGYQQLEELKCLTGNNECLVIHGINRKCHRCRLSRCFMMGMRKDFIVKKETKQKKKKYLEENLLNSNFIPQLLLDLDNDNNNIELNEMEETVLDTLSTEEWITIENLQRLFISTMQDDNAHKFGINISDRDSAIMSCLNYADQTALRFINFFRQINEFEDLNSDDRFILMKHNLLPVFPIYKCFNYKPDNHYFSCEENEETRRFNQFFMLFDETYDLRDTLVKLVISLVQLTNQDAMILCFILIILVFSQGLLMNEEEPILKDSLAVNRIQSYYINLFWNYLVNKWDEQQACKYFIQLLNMIFRLQSTSKIFQDFLRNHLTTRNSVDQITPLMQSVLNIS